MSSVRPGELWVDIDGHDDWVFYLVLSILPGLQNCCWVLKTDRHKSSVVTCLAARNAWKGLTLASEIKP